MINIELLKSSFEEVILNAEKANAGNKAAKRRFNVGSSKLGAMFKLERGHGKSKE